MTILCSRGCGTVATYLTKQGKLVCNKNAAKCTICNPKGKLKKTYAKAIPYNGFHTCDYGCNEVAQYQLKNGQYSCSSQGSNCSAVRLQAAKKISASKYVEIAPGTTLGKAASMKAAITKSEDIDHNGKNKHQTTAELVSMIKKRKIDPVTGLNVHQLTGIKYKVWLETSDGIKWLNSMSTITTNRQNYIDPLTGIKEATRRAKIMVNTKINDIDNFGLNGFERSHWKSGKNTGFINGIFWQYSNERRFLENAVSIGIINQIKRGTSIDYVYNGENKKYLPDFILDNKLFEIKSKYTMFGVNNSYLKQNIAKLQSADEFGYDVYIVLDDNIISFDQFLSSISNLLK